MVPGIMMAWGAILNIADSQTKNMIKSRYAGQWFWL